MGTLNDWLTILFFGVFWGGLMMFWITQPIEADERKKLRPYSILVCVLGGVLVGFVEAFGLRAFRRPVVTILIPTVVAFVVAKANHRKQIKLMRARESSPENR